MKRMLAAASARLCVETGSRVVASQLCPAAASARLCVETINVWVGLSDEDAAASARLCVETVIHFRLENPAISSRLRAAVC